MLHEGSLAEEIEVLEAIYIEELDVHRNDRDEIYKIILQLHPATGEDLDKRFVCMTLILDLSIQYPDVPPEITIRNPRGIAEEELLSLREDMHKLCEDRRGGAVLFELIELAKDSLTAGNIPHCLCMICLEHFIDGENYTKTECYHYFHENCLSRYVTHVLTNTPEVVPDHTVPDLKKSKIVCPVCREEISYKLDDLDSVPVEDSFMFTASPKMRDMQAKMKAIWMQQKASGGIIDLEAEKNKYLVKNDDVVLLAAPPKLAVTHETNARPKSGQSRNEKTCIDSLNGYQQRDSGRRSNESHRDNTDRDQGARTRPHSGYMKGKRRDMRFDHYKSYSDSDIGEQKKRDERKDKINSDRVLNKDLGYKNNRQDTSLSDREDVEYESTRSAREEKSEHYRSKTNRDQYKGKRKPTSYEVKCNEVKEKNIIAHEEKAKMNGHHYEARKCYQKEQKHCDSEQKESDKPQQRDTYKRINDSANKMDATVSKVELDSKRKYVSGTCNKSDGIQDGVEHRGFGRPTQRRIENELSDSTDKSEPNDSVDTTKRNNIVGNCNKGKRQGIGRPPTGKDSIESEKQRDEKHQLEQSETKSAISDSYQQKWRKSDEEVKLKGDLERSGKLKDVGQTFKSGRGGFDGPKDKKDDTEEYKGRTGQSSQNTPKQGRGRGGFGRPSEKYYRDGYYSDEKRTKKNRGGFGKPNTHDGEDIKENARTDSKHGSCETNKQDWQSDKIRPKNENLKLTKTGQRSEDFNLDKTSSQNEDLKPDKTKLNNELSQSKSGSRHWKNDRDRYRRDDGYNNRDWRSRESVPRSEGDENLRKYSDSERVNNGKTSNRTFRNVDVHERGSAGSGRFGNSSKSRENFDNSQDDCDGYEKQRNHDFTQSRNEADCARSWRKEGNGYSNRNESDRNYSEHQLGRGRGRGKYRGENQSEREFRSSPRNNKQVNGIGVGKKFNNLEILELESERAKKQERDGTSSKIENVDDADDKKLRDDVGDKKDRYVKKHGPPGFAVSPPPGFIGTESDGKSSDSKPFVQPPPGF